MCVRADDYWKEAGPKLKRFLNSVTKELNITQEMTTQRRAQLASGSQCRVRYM